jgi:hypothetical protein
MGNTASKYGIKNEDQLDYINLIITLKAKLRTGELTSVEKMETYNNLCNIYAMVNFELIKDLLEADSES